MLNAEQEGRLRGNRALVLCISSPVQILEEKHAENVIKLQIG